MRYKYWDVAVRAAQKARAPAGMKWEPMADGLDELGDYHPYTIALVRDPPHPALTTPDKWTLEASEPPSSDRSYRRRE